MTEPLSDRPFSRSGQGNASNLRVWIESVQLIGGSEIRPVKAGVTAVVGPNNVGKSFLLQCLYSCLANGQISLPPQVLEDVVVQKEGTRDDLIEWLSQHARWGPTQYDTSSTFRRLNHALTHDMISRWDSLQPTAAFWTHYFSADSYGQGFTSERAEAGTAPETPLQVLYERPSVMTELDRICFTVFREHLTLDEESVHLRLRTGRPSVPRPAVGQDRGPYRDAVARLKALAEEGHGMRSWMSIIVQLITGTFPIIIADEPELHLHPPQARALGTYLSKLARSTNCQVILATHDRNLLTGLLEDGSDLSVVRLERTPSRTFAHQLHSESVRDLWSDPVLRYGNALDGMFCPLVVVAEGQTDCTFFQAGLDTYQTNLESAKDEEADSDSTAANLSTHAFPVSDVLFVPANGKQGIRKLVAALRAVNVPVIVTVDLDILNPRESVLAELVEEMAPGKWQDLETLHRRATGSLTTPNALTKASLVRDGVVAKFEQLLNSDPDAVWDGETARPIKAVFKSVAGPSERLKSEGTNYASGDEFAAIQELLRQLRAIGIVPLDVGELERLARELPQNNKTRWLPKALAAHAYARPMTQDHIRLLLESASSLLGKAPAAI